MKKLNKIVLIVSLAFFTAGRLCAGQPSPQADGRTVIFRFLPGNDMFYVPWADNLAELGALARLVDEFRPEIAGGRMPVYVEGYCASLPEQADNLRLARRRANRVKSELITKHGLKEADFVTANYARTYRDYRDVVVVTLCLPATDEQQQPEPVKKESGQEQVPAEIIPGQQPATGEKTATKAEKPESVAEATTIPAPDTPPAKPYRFALRTNLLYDAVLLPTLGVEWRVNNRIGVRVDGSFSRWGGERGEIQRAWLVSPEVRWYLSGGRFYAGVAGNYGEYNLYGRVLGGLLSDDTGYKGRLWSAGLTVGYRLPLWRCISADFNLGLGYTRSEYDSYTAPYGTRVIRQHDRSKNLWGPMQAGVTLVWNFSAPGMKNKKSD